MSRPFLYSLIKFPNIMKKILSIALFIGLLSVGFTMAQQPSQPKAASAQKPAAQTQAQHQCGHNHGGCPHANGGHCAHHGQAVSQAPSNGLPVEITNAFPSAKSVKQSAKWTEVYDAKGVLLGYAVYSKPASDGIKGYMGETPVMIALNTTEVIIAVEMLKNNDTPGYVQKVKAAGLLESWNGQPAKKAAKKKVDVVSGATYTSRGVIMSLQAALNKLY